MKVDFTNQDQVGNWSVINDGVMGGLSKGTAGFSKQGVLFQGNISLENNGGFSSLRSPYKAIDLSEYQQVTIKYRSNGMDMAFQLDIDRRFYLPNMKMALPISES
jgi:hypothetical protein